MNLKFTPSKRPISYLVYISIFSAVLLSLLFFFNKNNSETAEQVSETKEISERYSDYLQHHPYVARMKMNKTERRANGLPPNKFYEQEYLLTSDPALLRPTPEKVFELQEVLKNNPQMRAPGAGINNWEERGPNNVGGRTRALIFAPGSTTKVIAGGVSGGLWINEDITNAYSDWQQVTGVPANMAVSAITVDPQNTNIMYIGTGEVYTAGNVNGNGVYKSTDGGYNWTHIYGQNTGPVEDRVTYIQDIIAWVNPVTSSTEILFGADASFYKEQLGNDVFLGSNTIGIYKSTDGTNFSRLTGATFESSPGTYYAPNTFDVNSNGTKVWMGTKQGGSTYEGGGVVFSYDGTNWTNVVNLNTDGRVEIVCSKQNPNKIYMLCEDQVSATQKVQIFRTTDAFATAPTAMPLPVDIEPGLPANDFTRGQSFYDLQIGVDPNNDATLFVGGIDIFKSTNSGAAWTQKVHWYGLNDLPNVHSDHHSIAFSGSNRIVFGNDGGIYFSDDGGDTYGVRNKGYNVTQYYKADINQDVSKLKLIAGAQDNGVNFIDNAQSGINSSVTISGGDGGWSFIDKDSQYIITSYTNTQYYVHDINGVKKNDFEGNSGAEGSFINECGLDSDTNYFYANSSTAAPFGIHRWKIDPVAFTATSKTLLTNGLITGQPSFFVASPFTSDRMFIGTAMGDIIRLDNASTASPTWTSKSISGMVGAVSDIRYGQTENDIMVTFHNYGVVSIWATTDGGDNWVNKEGDLPNMPVKTILQNPLRLDEVIIGTELGVWSTSNWSSSSPNWVQSQNGMSNVKVMNFEMRAADYTIVASTHGRGMFTGVFEPEHTFCASNGTTASHIGLTNVTLHTINNSDITKNSGYEDFSSIITEVRQGSSYDLSVKLNSDGANTVHVKAWIDWNNNSDFTDPGEEYDLGTATNVANGTTTLSPLSIPVSATASFGIKRMRVSAKQGSAATSCETNFDGEVEDYSIRVISPIIYCPAGGTDNGGDHIANVTLGTINNTSSDDAGGYGDYTTVTPTTLTSGSSQTLSITKGGGSDDGVGAWIDYNGDGDFNDANEAIGFSAHSSTPTITIPFTVPANITSINTRMRIAVQYQNSAPLPCGSDLYREVEDYTVTLVAGASPCTGITKTWNGLWAPAGAPNPTDTVIISSNYDAGLNGNIEACSLTITSGATVTVASGKFIRVQGDITVNAGTSLLVQHEGSLVQVNDAASVTNNGTISIQKTTPTLAEKKFMIMGSPMTAETREDVYNAAYIVRHHNTANFVPNPDVTAAFPAAENFADDNGNNWLTHTGTINPAEGYMVFPQPNTTGSGSYTHNYTLGTLNTGTITAPLAYHTDQNSSPNMLANPYASAIDANAFYANPANAAINVLYFWEHITPLSVSYPGYNAANFSMGDISLYSKAMGGVQAGNGGTTPTGIIASGQGFAVKAASAGITATFNNAMRVTGPNDTYRRPLTSERDRLWINVYNDSYGLGSTTLIGFSENTTNAFEADADIKRLATPVSLYSELGTGEELAINALGSFEIEASVGLSFSTQVKESQNYRISLQDLDGINIDTATVFLIDNLLGTVTNLSEGDYSFQSEEGTYSERFKVVFENSVLGTNDVALHSISVYPNPVQNVVNIVSPKAKVTSATVHDIRGRKVSEVNFRNRTNYQIDLSKLESAVYFVTIVTESGTLTKRVIKQ
ncbi:GEVED domain-containing protein [Ulvibacter litoralis]|uniref:Por secretion system C-terminal sorting domain-containing protein n=1 Tax=Ulvibacter litoralis TaxID=227084 RepID=A0A1G7GHH0_9FLAO|nr:GEVED domain-containing protein [Ulvibacter litoralis]GHC56156.1 hypothetical protein GCM10008083_20780 [Ulvibacter litoralis]SDE87602.1 Por secretion system C-terminal sorting domain-containing protein [Ulvibacter litoralis]